MDLLDEKVYEKTLINISVVVNNNIKDDILNYLKSIIKNKNFKLNSYTYDEVDKINVFNKEICKNANELIQNWIEKIRSITSIIIFCIDWQNILNNKTESNIENEINIKRENINIFNKNIEEKENIKDSNKKKIYNENNKNENSDINYNFYKNNEEKDDQMYNKKNEYIENVEYMKKVNDELIKKIQEINKSIQKTKKVCKIVILVILPEKTKNTDLYIKQIALLNGENINAIFITLGLKEIHNKMERFEILLNDNINYFFKQHLISYERKCYKNYINYFNYCFKKGYILETLEKHDDALKIYIHLCKTFYENNGEETFQNKKVFYEYIIFFNSISLRMIFIYMYKEIKKAILHIYMHKKLLYSTLIYDLKEKQKKFDKSIYNKIKKIDFINYINYVNNSYKNIYNELIEIDENNQINKENNQYNPEEINNFILYYYEKTIKKYLYYNLLSCLYFYFYNLLKEKNINIYNICLYGLYTSICIYKQIKALNKRNTLMNQFPNVQFEKYNFIKNHSDLCNFLLNFLINIFQIISLNNISDISFIIAYYIILLFYQKKNYIYSFYLLLELFNNKENPFFILNILDEKNKTKEKDIYDIDIFVSLENFEKKKTYINYRNFSLYGCFLYIMINCFGEILNYEKDNINILNNKKKIKNYENLFLNIVFEYLNDCIINKKEKEEKKCIEFIKNYFKVFNTNNIEFVDIDICFSNIYIDLYYLINDNTIQIFVNIKNESLINFSILPFIGFLINNKQYFFKLQFSKVYKQKVYFFGELINESNLNNYEFLYEYIKNENFQKEEYNEENISFNEKKRNNLYLNDNNFISLIFCLNIRKQEILINNIELFISFFNKIIKLNISEIFCMRILMKQLKENINFEEDKQIQNETINNNIIKELEKTKNYRKLEDQLFEIKKETKSTSYYLQNHIFFEIFKNKIVYNIDYLNEKNILNKYVSYFIHSNNNDNHTLYLHEYNVFYIFIKYCKNLKNIQFSISYINEDDNFDLYLLTENNNILNLYLMKNEENVIFSENNVYKLLKEDNKNNDILYEINKEKNIISSDDKYSIFTDKNSSETSIDTDCNINDNLDKLYFEPKRNVHNIKENSTNIKNKNDIFSIGDSFNNIINNEFKKNENELNKFNEKNFFFFEIEGVNENICNKKVKKIYGKSNFHNNTCISYSIKKNKNKENKNNYDIKSSEFIYYINDNERLLCIPFFIYPKKKKYINFYFDISFKNVNFEDDIKYIMKYYIEPSFLTVVTKITNVNKNMMNHINTYSNKTNMYEIKNENEENNLIDNKNIMYYIYLYNNTRNNIILKNIKEGKLNKCTKIKKKCTYCDLIQTNENFINIYYKYDFNNFFFPFNKFLKEITFIKYVKLPFEEIKNEKSSNNMNNTIKRSKIKIEMNYEKFVKFNEVFVVESIITNETNITEEIIIFLFDKNLKKNQNLKKNKILKDSTNDKSKNTDINISEESTIYSSSDYFENLADQKYDVTKNYEIKKRDYLITGIQNMKNILLPFQTIKLKWYFIPITYGFINLPNVIVKRKAKIKNNVNIFFSQDIQLFVI